MWRRLPVREVAYRPAAPVDVGAPLAADDPRLIAGMVTAVRDGRYVGLRKPNDWPEGYISERPPVRLDDTTSDAVRAIREYGSLIAVVDTDQAPVGVLEWTDLVRFALERGAGEPWWQGSAAFLEYDLTLLADIDDPSPPENLLEVARSLLRRAEHGEPLQVVTLYGNVVDPETLLEAIFDPSRL